MLDCINPVNNLKNLLEIDTCCTAPAVCGLDDLVQGDERGLQARKLNKQVDCLLIVCLQSLELLSSLGKTSQLI